MQKGVMKDWHALGYQWGQLSEGMGICGHDDKFESVGGGWD